MAERKGKGKRILFEHFLFLFTVLGNSTEVFAPVLNLEVHNLRLSKISVLLQQKTAQS